MDIFQNITTNSVKKIVKFLESTWTVNKPDFDKFGYSSGYTLSNNTKAYDAKYLMQEYAYEIKYDELLITGLIHKRYGWNNYAGQMLD